MKRVGTYLGILALGGCAGVTPVEDTECTVSQPNGISYPCFNHLRPISFESRIWGNSGLVELKGYDINGDGKPELAEVREYVQPNGQSRFTKVYVFEDGELSQVLVDQETYADGIFDFEYSKEEIEMLYPNAKIEEFLEFPH